MRIAVILAMARNGVIGRDGTLPWHLPDDLKNFRRLTWGKPIVMGRRTWESLPGPLPQRRCLVISGRPLEGGCERVADPEAALAQCADSAEVMIVGGVRVYRHFLPRCDRLHLTTVEADIDGGVRLPELDLSGFRAVREDRHPADARHAHAFVYREFERTDA